MRFWRRVRQVRAQRRARGREAGIVAEDEGKLRRVISLLTENRDMLQARLRALKGVASLQHWLNVSTKEGYGRLDAFGIGRDELFGATTANSMPANSPVSFPHIWGIETTAWLQSPRVSHHSRMLPNDWQSPSQRCASTRCTAGRWGLNTGGR